LLEDPTPFASCCGDPAHVLHDDCFLVVAESGERFSRRFVVDFQVKVADGKRRADAVRRGERQNLFAGHGSSLRASGAAIFAALRGPLPCRPARLMNDALGSFTRCAVVAACVYPQPEFAQ
jgi:hypothetical protein